MQFGEYLAYSPINYLQQLAREHGLNIVMYSKSILLQELLSRFCDKGFIAQAVENMNVREKLALKLILFAGTKRGISKQEAIDQVESLLTSPREEAKACLESLNRKGFLFLLEGPYKESLYVVPADLEDMLIEIFLQEVSVEEEASSPSEYRDDGMAVLTDIFHLLAVVAKTDIRFTQQDILYKRCQKQITDGFVVRADTPVETTGYGMRLDLIISYALDRNLTRKDNGHLIVGRALPAWLSWGAEKQLKDVFTFWQKHYGRTNPYLDTFLAILSRLPKETWVSYQNVVDNLHNVIVSDVSAVYASELGLQAIQQLLFMGAVVVGFVQQQMMFYVTTIGRCLFSDVDEGGWLLEERTFFLQPDYEILIPQSLDKTILWQIEELADLKRADAMLVYQLSKKSIYYALQQGWRQKHILALLVNHSKNGVPQNVEMAIKDWAGQYGRMHFLETCILRCDSAKITDEIMASTRLQKFIQGQLTEKDLLVDREDYEAFLVALQDEGYMPYVGIFTPKQERCRQPN